MRALCLVILTLFCLSAAPASAQSRATSYNFASSSHTSIDLKTSFLGNIVETVDVTLNQVRGERGMLLFVGSAALALLSMIYGMRQAALAAALIASGILLVNKPGVVILTAIPLAVIKRKALIAFLQGAGTDRHEPVAARTQAVQAPVEAPKKRARRSKALNELSKGKDRPAYAQRLSRPL